MLPCRAQSALEMAKLCHDSLDALFDMGLSLPPETMTALMAGVDAGLQR